MIHSRAFRRLEYKTQVFLNGTADHLRTRLTHTFEVASVSRTIARALALNEDLAEAIALAHDLGHSPFGHSGEEMLAECMREHGGFEHNRHSLRVVELLETVYMGKRRRRHSRRISPTSRTKSLITATISMTRSTSRFSTAISSTKARFGSGATSVWRGGIRIC